MRVRNIRSFLCAAMLTLLCFGYAFADSTMTSIEFYKAYLDVPQVAASVKSVLTPTLFAFVDNANVPIDQRLAVVNAFPWNTEGTHNGRIFIDQLATRMKKSPNAIALRDLRADELLLLGYMLARDDYFKDASVSTRGGELERTSPLAMVNAAAAAQPKDFSYQLIAALVRAKQYKEEQWGRVYTEVQSVIESRLDRNMRDEAVTLIKSYTDEYKRYATMSRDRSDAQPMQAKRTIQTDKGVYTLLLDHAAQRLITTNGDEKRILVWNVPQGKVDATVECGEFTDSVRFINGESQLVVSDWQPAVTVYSFPDMKVMNTLRCPVRVLDVAHSPGGSVFALARFDGLVDIYSSAWKPVASLPAHDKYVSNVSFSPDGRYLLTSSYDRTVKLWDARQGYALAARYDGFKNGTFARYIAGGRAILVRDFSNSIKIFDPMLKSVTWERQLPETVHDVAASPDGKLIVAATENGVVYLWNRAGNKEAFKFKAHDDQVLSARFSDDGNTLLTCGLDKRWKTWTVEDLRVHIP